MSGNALLQASLSIPSDVRPALAGVVDRTRGRVTFRQPELEYLFTVYNRYIAPHREPEDMNCRGCRAKVVGKLRAMVDGWREYGYLEA